MKILGKKRKQAIPEPRSRKWAGGFTIQGRWTKHGSTRAQTTACQGISCSDWAAIWIWLPRKTRERDTTEQDQGRKTGNRVGEAESFYITFDDEGLAEVTWINPCIVEENEGGGVFLLPFSDILQVFQKSITKQYILEMLSGNGLEVSATIQTIRLGYRRIETEDKDGKKKKEQIIPVWDFIGTYSSPQTEQLWQMRMISGCSVT